MSALLERQILSETLTHDELAEITGCVRYGGQIAWLYENGWKHHYSRSWAPIVGRWYARLKLAGITPRADNAEAWAPNFATIK